MFYFGAALDQKTCCTASAVRRHAVEAGTKSGAGDWLALVLVMLVEPTNIGSSLYRPASGLGTDGYNLLLSAEALSMMPSTAGSAMGATVLASSSGETGPAIAGPVPSGCEI